MLLSHHCDEIVIVKDSTDVLPVVLEARGWVWRYVTQPKPTGVFDALWRGLVAAKYDDCIVAFADNVYDLYEEIPTGDMLASVRAVDNPQLDYFENAGWHPCNGAAHRMSFAGWLAIDRRKVAVSMNRTDLMSVFNASKIKPIIAESYWHDIGTPESYIKYWKPLQVHA